MNNLLATLNTVNAIEDNNEFLSSAKALIVHDFINSNEDDIENMMTMALLESENDDNADAVNEFSTRLQRLMSDMDYNDTEHMEASNSRVYTGWANRDQSLPKLSTYTKEVGEYLASVRG